MTSLLGYTFIPPKTVQTCQEFTRLIIGGPLDTGDVATFQGGPYRKTIPQVDGPHTSKLAIRDAGEHTSPS